MFSVTLNLIKSLTCSFSWLMQNTVIGTMGKMKCAACNQNWFVVFFMVLCYHNVIKWLGGVVVRSWTSDSEVAGSIPTRTAVE